MKTARIITTLLLTVFGLPQMEAQSEDRFSIGPRVGINLANVTNVDESQSITGIVVGVTSTYSFSQHTGLTVDALYSVEGYKGPFENYHLRYIHIPVYFDYFFGELGQRVRPKIYVGLSPAFFTSGTLNELDVNETYFNKFILHATGGAGFNWRMADRIWMNADVRAFMGLHDIRSEDFTTGDAIQPRNVQLSLGFAYGLGKI